MGRTQSHTRWAVITALSLGLAHASGAQTPKLNDLEMAHIAVTASNIDIAYAHLALAFSENADIRGFAETMIRDRMSRPSESVPNQCADDGGLSEAAVSLASGS